METTSEMMIMVKLIMPPAPIPATPRPMIKAVMVGAAPQMRDPVKKKKMAAIIVFFLDKFVPMKSHEKQIGKKRLKVSSVLKQLPGNNTSGRLVLYLPKISLSLPYKGWTAVLVSRYAVPTHAMS